MIYVVFVEPKTPGNIGFLARTMKNFGLNHLVLINPCQLEHEAYYQSMHAREIIYNRQEYNSLTEFLKKVSIDFVVGTTGTAGGSYNLPRISITPENLAQSLNIQGDIALVFGREGDGLTNQELELCDLVVSIPTHESYPILNITHAAAIIFYELFKTQKKYPVEDLDEASLDEKNRLIDYTDEVLDKLDYPPHKQKNASIVFKRVLGRAFISGREAHTLKGMFRRIRDRIN
ncbi:MAG TPA: TrmJ/YjtD family RNA methyltransferase [Methanothermobacter sp.]|jgi:TrmH family RNA methyltransferase|nr:TrmJ/YjtD family RNA methyltransferase [Methanothermobacter sp.]